MLSDPSLNLVDRVASHGVGLAAAADFLASVHDGRMIAFAEQVSDLLEAERGVGANHVHRDAASEHIQLAS